MQKKNSPGRKSDDNHTDCDRIFARARINFRTYSIVNSSKFVAMNRKSSFVNQTKEERIRRPT